MTTISLTVMNDKRNTYREGTVDELRSYIKKKTRAGYHIFDIHYLPKIDVYELVLASPYYNPWIITPGYQMVDTFWIVFNNETIYHYFKR